MISFKTVLSEHPLYLIRLYGFKEFFHELEDHTSNLYLFVQDPYHFDYSLFEARWWPLLQLSDLGIPAMKHGRDKVVKVIATLDKDSRLHADRYVNLFTEKNEIDPSDIYYIPNDIKSNPIKYR